jgi:predicted transcriptional regulator
MKDKIEKYLEENGLTKTSFAKALGVTPVAVGRYISGERLPEPEIMSEIFKVTKGQITPNDFYGVE